MERLVGPSDVAKKRKRLAWLLSLLASQSFQAKKIVNFGCNAGAETYGLAMTFGTEVVVGVDKQHEIVCNAMRNRSRLCASKPTFQELRIELIVSDMSSGIGLRSGYFDLTYCANVLDKIAGQAGARPKPALLTAIGAMVRVARAGGFVVAEEYSIYDNSDIKLDLIPLFDRFPIKRIPCAQRSGPVRYVYRKSNNGTCDTMSEPTPSQPT